MSLQFLEKKSLKRRWDQIVAAGAPKQVAPVEEGHTGRYLRSRVGDLERKAAERNRR